MTNLNSNILLFPIPRTPLMSAPRQSTAETPAQLLPVINGNASPVGDDDYREHVATIVGAAIRAGRRKGRSLSSLLPQLRKWLVELCDHGEPSAIMVHDWLNGNRRYLAHSAGALDAPISSSSRPRVDGEEGA